MEQKTAARPLWVSCLPIWQRPLHWMSDIIKLVGKPHATPFKDWRRTTPPQYGLLIRLFRT